MFDYDLTGRLVILVLDKDILPALAGVGIQGSPIAGQVYKMEQGGLWLDNPRFNLCPIGTKRVYTAGEVAVCHAHVFIPAAAIISVATFPDNDKMEMPEDSGYQRIGFITPEEK